MSQNDSSEYGKVRLISPKSFEEYGTNQEERAESIANLWSLEPGMQTIRLSPSDWSKITKAIHKNSRYTIRTETPVLSAELSFSLEQKDSGHYSLKYKPNGPSKSGITTDVTENIKVENNPLMFPLEQFKYHFKVTTTEYIWLIGLLKIDEVSESDDEK